MSSSTTRPTDHPSGDRSIGQIIASVSDDLKSVVSAEVALAKLEVQASLKEAAKGAPMLVVAGVLALYALGLLLTAAAWALALVWPTWLAFLAVGVLLVALAGVLALAGIRLLKKVDPKPTRAIAHAQETLAAVKEGREAGAEHAALLPPSRAEVPLSDRPVV